MFVENLNCVTLSNSKFGELISVHLLLSSLQFLFVGRRSTVSVIRSIGRRAWSKSVAAESGFASLWSLSASSCMDSWSGEVLACFRRPPSLSTCYSRMMADDTKGSTPSKPSCSANAPGPIPSEQFAHLLTAASLQDPLPLDPKTTKSDQSASIDSVS